MSTRSRILHLPISMDTRTCSRWACLQRIPGTGPDPAVLSHHVQRTVNDVAAIVIDDAEVKGSLQATEHYVTAFLDRYWPAIPKIRKRNHATSFSWLMEDFAFADQIFEAIGPNIQWDASHIWAAGSNIVDAVGPRLILPASPAVMVSPPCRPARSWRQPAPGVLRGALALDGGWTGESTSRSAARSAPPVSASLTR